MIKKQVKNIVFFSGGVNVRSGGPGGYIANLESGVLKTGYNRIKFIYKIHDSKDLKLRKTFIRILSFWVPVKQYRKRFRLYLSKKIKGMSWDDVSLKSLHYSDLIKELDKYEFDSITCHYVKDALFIRNYLQDRKSKAKLILMSHSPEPPSEEMYAVDKASKNPYAEENYIKWKTIEREAFCHAADILLFPSKESIEPYSNTLEYFKDIKNFVYLETGCCPIKSEYNYEELVKKYNIKTDFVISYIGRHNKIKGYDLLKNIAEKILKIRKDVTFLIGGRQGNEIKPLDNDRWIELGFVNPADVLKVSDCFILPNRQTYFDLVLLEVLSMGCPVFASNTGGNKAVYKKTKAITLYDTEDECVNKIIEFLDLFSDERRKIINKVQKAYDDNYTIEIFAKNYIEMIKNI